MNKVKVMAVVIVLRDFFVTGLRNFGADKKQDLAASLSGKVKTVFQLLAVILALVGTYNFGDFINLLFCFFTSFR